MTKSWEFFNGGSYAANVYQKAAVTLLTLEGYLGEDVMARVMKTYFERWKFRHPRSEDFFAVAEDVSGRDLDWFFDQFFKSPDKLDYAVSVVRSTEIIKPEGKPGAAKAAAPDAPADLAAAKPNVAKNDPKPTEKMFDNEVVVIRNAELVFPQEILVVFEDGKEVRETWDGKDRWKRFKYTGPSKLKMARLDPEGKIPLDANQMNNSRLAAPDKAPLRRHALGVLLAFQKFLSFVAF
jgi:heme exporter protein D